MSIYKNRAEKKTTDRNIGPVTFFQILRIQKLVFEDSGALIH
jgi:hypothetical protein